MRRRLRNCGVMEKESKAKRTGKEGGKRWCFCSLENLHQSQACLSQDVLGQAGTSWSRGH